MNTITLQEFKDKYCPLENNITPFPQSFIKKALGNAIWDKSDYSRIASQLRDKTIWTILEDDSSYYITSTIIQNAGNELIGYVVTKIPYETNDIANIQVTIDKSDFVEELFIF